MVKLGETTNEWALGSVWWDLQRSSSRHPPALVAFSAMLPVLIKRFPNLTLRGPHASLADPPVCTPYEALWDLYSPKYTDYPKEQIVWNIFGSKTPSWGLTRVVDLALDRYWNLQGLYEVLDERRTAELRRLLRAAYTNSDEKRAEKIYRAAPADVLQGLSLRGIDRKIFVWKAWEATDMGPLKECIERGTSAASSSPILLTYHLLYQGYITPTKFTDTLPEYTDIVRNNLRVLLDQGSLRSTEMTFEMLEENIGPLQGCELVALLEDLWNGILVAPPMGARAVCKLLNGLRDGRKSRGMKVVVMLLFALYRRHRPKPTTLPITISQSISGLLGKKKMEEMEKMSMPNLSRMVEEQIVAHKEGILALGKRKSTAGNEVETKRRRVAYV